MEANSLLIQTTLGCTHNKCTFCDMFREKRFRIRKIEEIFKDIDEARSTFRHVGSIFLIDGNVLALKPESSSRQPRCRSLRRKSTSWKTWRVLRLFTGGITVIILSLPGAYYRNPKISF